VGGPVGARRSVSPLVSPCLALVLFFLLAAVCEAFPRGVTRLSLFFRLITRWRRLCE